MINKVQGTQSASYSQKIQPAKKIQALKIYKALVRLKKEP